MEHTQGKWEVATNDDGYLPEFIVSGETVIATMEYNRDGNNTEEVIAALVVLSKH